jgi:putative oxidoreductase
MKKLIGQYNRAMSNLTDVPLLAMRLALAYGFYTPAKNKWEDINAIGDWFAGMGLPAPYFQAYLAAGTEAAGVVLLAIGFGTRFITIPLMITMLVAIKTVHWENGFNASDNGYEIPLYYLIMLFSLLAFGGGRASVDFLLGKLMQKKDAGK